MRISLGGDTTMSFYWRAFNLFGRITGLGFVIAGLAVAISWASDSSTERLLGIVAGSLVAVMGTGLLLVRPYRPDLGDSAWRPSRQRRTWWTGEPKDSAAAP